MASTLAAAGAPAAAAMHPCLQPVMLEESGTLSNASSLQLLAFQWQCVVCELVVVVLAGSSLVMEAQCRIF